MSDIILPVSDTERYVVRRTPDLSFTWLFGENVRVEPLKHSVEGYRKGFPRPSYDMYGEAFNVFWERKNGDPVRVEKLFTQYLCMMDLDSRVVQLVDEHGQYCDVVVYALKGDVSDRLVEDVRAWYRGDVYTLLFETVRRHTDVYGSVTETWGIEQPGDVLHGVVGCHVWTVKKVRELIYGRVI